MVERYPTLERGEPAMETKRKHIPIRLYKQARRLDDRMEEIKLAISQINILNAGKKRDEAFHIISKWLPDAEKFTAQVKTVDDYIRRLEQGNKAYEQRLENENDCLKGKISDKEDSLLKYRSEVYHLQEAIRQQKRLLDKIPTEVFEQIKVRKDRSR